MADGLLRSENQAPPTDVPRWTRSDKPGEKPPDSTDLKTFPGVVQSDLNGAAWADAYDHVSSHCYFCDQPLGEFAVPVFASIDRDRSNHGIYPYMTNARIVSPSAFACFGCVVRKATHKATLPAWTGIFGSDK